jgi:hypothetical protein
VSFVIYLSKSEVACDSTAGSNHHVSGILPSELSLLTGLEFLELADNSLSGTLPAALSALTALTFLYVVCLLCLG